MSVDNKNCECDLSNNLSNLDDVMNYNIQENDRSIDCEK